jgi:hypothetical protein
MPDEPNVVNLHVESTPQAPQEPWNPPGGDADFDSFFSGVGKQGEEVADSNAIPPVEPTTEPTEPVAPVTAEPPRAPEFVLKTATGTVYKTPEDAVRGIEQKDQLISQLRSMVSAVTGEDPLRKSGAVPGQTTAQPQPVSYLRDSRRYAEDLTKAADAGQKTGNWDAYRNVQAQLQFEVTQQAVGPYMPVVQNVGRQQAMDEVSRSVPEFRKFYGSEEYNKVLESRPKLAGFIQLAETQPTLQEELKELYHSVYDSAQAAKLPELVKQNQPPSNPTPAPRMPIAPMTRPSLNVPDQGRTPSQTPKPGLQTSAQRQALIEQLKQRGVEDFVF